MSKGSVTKRCGCSFINEHGKRKQLGRSCPKLRRSDGSWNPRHGTWGYAITVQDKGSDHQVSKAGFATQAEAQAELDTVRDKANRGQSVTVRLTVGEYLDEWLASKTDVRGNTLRSYTAHVRKHLKPHLGHVRLDALRVQHVADALAEVTSSDANKQRVRATLRAALHDAERQGLVSSNVAKLVKLPSGAAPKALVWTPERVERWQSTGEVPSAVMVWTPQQAGTFLDAISDDPLYPLFHLIAHVGLRRGEAVGLEWSDTDLSAATLVVRINRTVVGAEVTEGAPKSEAGGRVIALDAGTVATLKSHRKAQLSERMRFGPDRVDSGKVFTVEGGSALHPNTVSARFVALTKNAELPPIRVHDLRHCAASFALAAGADLKQIQSMLGHSTIQLTANTYSTVLPEVSRAAAEATASFIQANRGTAE